MLSLADHEDLVGFFSYSRDDDEDSDNGLSRLRMRIQNELRAQMGRSRESLRLWQDREAIAAGTLWESEIDRAVQSSSFFIPIITPRVVRSKYCQFEFDKFLARERELNRTDLIFPILYIGVSALATEKAWREDRVLQVVGERQYVDWCVHRHEPDSVALRIAIEKFCRSIVVALERQSPKVRPPQNADAGRPEAATEPQARQESWQLPRPLPDYRPVWRHGSRKALAGLASGADWPPFYSALYFLIVGAFSGLTSFFTNGIVPIEIDKYVRPGLSPPLLFSACVCYALYHTARILTLRMLVIVPIVSLGWIIAVQTAARLTLYVNEAKVFSDHASDSRVSWLELASGGLVGGLIGGSSVILAIMLCGKNLLELRSALYGLALAVVFGVLLAVNDLALMIIWQGGLLGFIAYSLKPATPNDDR